MTLTDGSGRFSFGTVAPGSYSVVVTHDKYAPSDYRADPHSISLSPGQKVEGMSVQLLPYGVIAGRIVDEKNEPMARATVQCLRITYAGGHRKLVSANGTSTDDLGGYRLFGVAPGRYLVTAAAKNTRPITGPSDDIELTPEARDAASRGYPTRFFPNATNAEAAASVEVPAGAEVQGVDIRLEPMRTFRIHGTVLTSAGAPATAADVVLWSRDQSGRSNGPPTFSRTRSNKAIFEFSTLAPGSYLLGVNSVIGDLGREEAWQPVQVGESDMELRVVLNKPIELEGSVVLDPQSDDAMNVKVVLEGTHLGGRLQADAITGRPFAALIVPPPDAYDVSVLGMPEDMYVKAVRLGNTDYSNSAVEIDRGGASGELVVEIAKSRGEVDGSVTATDGSPSVGATVVLVPEGAQRELSRLYKVALSDGTGAFSLKGLAPGKYSLYAWTAIEKDAYRDPEFLKPFESARKNISIEDGTHERVNLTVISPKRDGVDQ